MSAMLVYLILVAAVGGYAIGVQDGRAMRSRDRGSIAERGLGRSGDSPQRRDRAVSRVSCGTPGRPGHATRHLRVVR